MCYVRKNVLIETQKMKKITKQKIFSRWLIFLRIFVTLKLIGSSNLF